MAEDKDIVEGFNAGYLIQMHRPELAKQLVTSVVGVEMPFIEGFVAGTQEYVKEGVQKKVIAKFREASKETISKQTKNKEHDGKKLDKEY